MRYSLSWVFEGSPHHIFFWGGEGPEALHLEMLRSYVWLSACCRGAWRTTRCWGSNPGLPHATCVLVVMKLLFLILHLIFHSDHGTRSHFHQLDLRDPSSPQTHLNWRGVSSLYVSPLLPGQEIPCPKGNKKKKEKFPALQVPSDSTVPLSSPWAEFPGPFPHPAHTDSNSYFIMEEMVSQIRPNNWSKIIIVP